MSSKLDRFTRSALRALTLAQVEALRLHHEAIGTEHLLLGLVRETNSLAGQVLREMGVEPGQVIRAVERTVGRGETAPSSKPTLSPMAKKVIELSVDEARLMGHQYIGAEHLWLGLVRQEQGTAVNVLLSLGLDLNRLSTEISHNILQGQAQVRQEDNRPVMESEKLAAWLAPLHFDLTNEAEEGKLDPLIGRQEVIDHMIQILGRRAKNNPILVGEPGVGKRAIVRGLAQHMVEGKVPPSLLFRRLLVLDASHLVTSIVYGELVQKRVKKVLDEGATSNSLLFIDNIHRMVSAGGTGVDVANVIKLALIRGELQVIGATTPSQYRKYIDADAAREWSIQPIEVKESSAEETIQILMGIKSRYEKHHQLLIEDEALHVAAHLASRYVAGRFLPDKAIDLIDEASSRVRMHRMPNASEVRETYLNLMQVKKLKQVALDTKRVDDASKLGQREVELEAKLEELREAAGTAGNEARVTLEDVAEVASMWTGVPVSRLIDEERTRLQGA